MLNPNKLEIEATETKKFQSLVISGSHDSLPKKIGRLSDKIDYRKTIDILNLHFQEKFLQEFCLEESKEEKFENKIIRIFTRKKDGQRFLVKSAYKTSEEENQKIEADKGRFTAFEDATWSERMGFVNSLISSVLYKRILYNRSALVTPALCLSGKAASNKTEKNEEDKVYFTSKFFENAQTLAQFVKSGSWSKEDWSKMRKVKGWEKYLAGILRLGEYDFHFNNILIVKEINEKGEEELVFAKIDDDFSPTKIYSDPIKMYKGLYSALKVYRYMGNIGFNISEFKRALQSNFITKEERERLIESRIHNLGKNKFCFYGLEGVCWFDLPTHNSENAKTLELIDYVDLREEDKKELEELKAFHIRRDIYYVNYFQLTMQKRMKAYYMNMFAIQDKTVEEFISILEKIEKMDKAPHGWIEGRWIEIIGYCDPNIWIEKYQSTVKIFEHTLSSLQFKGYYSEKEVKSSWDEMLCTIDPIYYMESFRNKILNTQVNSNRVYSPSPFGS